MRRRAVELREADRDQKDVNLLYGNLISLPKIFTKRCV